MPQFQTTRFGLPTGSQGSSLYGGTAPMDWEERSTGTNGLGKRLGGRTYWRKFGDAFTTGGQDTVAFKSGHMVHISISNFQDPGFTYAAATVPGSSWQTTYLDPLCARIAALPFNAAASGGLYGGFTQPAVKVTLMHEVNAKAKAGAFGSSVANTPAEWKAFNKFFASRLVAAGCRANVILVFVSTAGIDFNTLEPYWDATIFDEWGVDLYCNMPAPGFTWNGSKASYATNLAPALAWARKKGITKVSHPEFGVGDFHDSSMTQWFTDMANYLLTITDIKFTDIIHWGQANHADQNLNALAAQDTGTGIAHPQKHAGVISFMSIMQGNEILTGAAPTTPPAPTGLTAGSAPDGKSINFGWAAVGSPGDRMDFYIQGPGDTFPKKDNTSPLPVTPRSYTFSKNILSGTPYIVTAVLSDSTTALRSGFATKPDGTLLGITTSTPGPANNYPQIVSATATVDPMDPLHYTLAVVATDPDIGQTLSYQWVVTNVRTGVAADPLIGATVEFHAQTEDDYDALLGVTDSGTPPLTTPQHVPFSVQISPSFTDFLHMRMLQTGENIQEAGVIDRATKPAIDRGLQGAYFRKSAHNAIFHMAASSCDPRHLSGSTTYTAAAQDLLFSVMKMEDVKGVGFSTVTSRAMIGSGIVIGFWDMTGLLVDSYVGMDHLLTQAAGGVTEPFPNILTDFGPDDLFISGIWHPAAGMSTTPIYRVGAVGTVEALINAPLVGGNPLAAYGGLTGVATFPTQLDFSKLSNSIGQIYLGVALPSS